MGDKAGANAGDVARNRQGEEHNVDAELPSAPRWEYLHGLTSIYAPRKQAVVEPSGIVRFFGSEPHLQHIASQPNLPQPSAPQPQQLEASSSDVPPLPPNAVP